MQNIQDEIGLMQADLETLLPSTGNEAVERAIILAAYLARSGTMLADAKRLARKKRSSEIGETIIKIAKESFLSAKAQNALVDSIAEEELYLVDALDRINSTCVHQIDLLRSIISKEKAELQYLNFNHSSK